MNKAFKCLSAFYLIFTCSGSAVSQQSFVNQDWVRTNGINGNFENVSLHVSSSGNVFNLSNQSNGVNSDNLLSCVHSGGNLIWEQYCSSSAFEDDFSVDLALDSLQNAYICAAKHNGDDYDFLIAKYDAQGILVWEQIYNSGTNDDVPAALALSNNDLFITGSSKGNGVDVDMLTMKINVSNGNIDWIKTFDHLNKIDLATDIAVNSSGDVFVSGSSAQNAVNSDMVIINYSGVSGVELNNQRYITPGNGYDFPREILVDENDMLILMGTSKANLSNSNIEVKLLTNALQPLWTFSIDESGLKDEGNSIELDNNGDILLTGYCTSITGKTSTIITKIDKGNGAGLWSRTRQSEDGNVSKGVDLTINSNGDIYVCGEEDHLGSRNIFTMALSEYGELKWMVYFKDTVQSFNQARKIEVHNNSVYVAGVSKIGQNSKSLTVKYSINERVLTPVIDSLGNYSHVKNELVVRFDRSVLNLANIDKVGFTSGQLMDFVDSSTISLMSNKTGFDWSRLSSYKIHTRATSADTLSITRLDDTVKVSHFWGSLIVKLPESTNEVVTSDSINTIPGIHYSHINPIFTPYGVDPYFQDGQHGLWFSVPSQIVTDIDADVAWAYETGSSDVRVGVIDAIIDWNHEDFYDQLTQSTKIVGGHDYFNDSDISFGQYTLSNHGTSVAGIIGAIRNNSLGVAGVAGGDMDAVDPSTGVPIYSLAIVNDFGNFTSWDRIAAAMNEGSLQTTNGYGFALNVENLSWGTTNGPHADMTDALNNCWKNHCILVAARPNFSDATTNAANWPACYSDEQLITVSASGNDGHRKTDVNGEGDWYSGYGTSGALNTSLCDVDVMAPGISELIATTKSTFANPYTYSNCSVNNSLYNCFDGTSAAAPHVSGVAALLLSKHTPSNGYPNKLGTEDVENLMQKNASFSNNYTLEDAYGVVSAGKSMLDINDPYYVMHMNHYGWEGTTTWEQTLNNIYMYGATELGIPNGTPYYSVSRYLFELDFNDYLINTTDEIVDSWDFRAFWREGAQSFTGNTFLYNPFLTVSNFSAPIGSNSATGTVSTYFYQLKRYPTSNPVWFPFDPNEFRYSYSVHAKKNPLGISELQLESSSLFPNPNNGVFSLTFSANQTQNVYIKVYDIMGKVVYENDNVITQKGEVKLKLNLENLEKGLYYVKINNESIPFVINE